MRPARRSALGIGVLVLGGAACALVAGCTLGPDYARPKIDAPPAFHYELADAANTANTAWWKSFNDPTLDALIAEALANNLNLKMAVANVEQATAVVTQVRSQLFPQVGYGAGAQRARTTESNLPPELARLIANPQSAYQAALSATWEIDLWGRIRRLSESALANALAAEDARRGVILSVVSTVARDYIQLRGLDEQLAIAKQTLQAYGESVRLFELQFKYGQVSQMNVAQAQSQYEAAAAEIPQIESQIAQTRERAFDPGRTQPRSDCARKIDLRAYAAGRPGGRALAAPRAATRSHAGGGAAWSLPTPRSVRRRRSTFRPYRSPASSAARAPICRSSFRDRRACGATRDRRRADLHLRCDQRPGRAGRGRPGGGARELSAIDPERVRRRGERARREREAHGPAAGAGAAGAALKTYERLAMLQYNGGYTSYTTVLQAQQSLFPAELTLASVHAAVFSSAVSIYQAMGGGWIDIAADMSAAPKMSPAREADARQPLF